MTVVHKSKKKKGVGPSKFAQLTVNNRKIILKSLKTALSDLILIPKWGF
jgi:hypothetical protein